MLSRVHNVGIMDSLLGNEAGYLVDLRLEFDYLKRSQGIANIHRENANILMKFYREGAFSCNEYFYLVVSHMLVYLPVG